MLAWTTSVFGVGLREGRWIRGLCATTTSEERFLAGNGHRRGARAVKACATKDLATDSEVKTPAKDGNGIRTGRVNVEKAKQMLESQAEEADDVKEDWESDNEEWVAEGWEKRVGMEDENGKPVRIEDFYAERRKRMKEEKGREVEVEEKILAGEITEGILDGGNAGIIDWENALRQQAVMARGFWKEVVCFGDNVVDATCGNGKDSVDLLKMLRRAGEGMLICVDLQNDAIENTKTTIAEERHGDVVVEFHQMSHESFPTSIKPETVALVVYNLGFLPGGDESLITMPETTLKSLDAATKLLRPFGMISVMLYQGHEGGMEEKRKVLEWSKQLDSATWSCTHFEWTNRHDAPSLLLVRKVSL
eukprot:Plantae.Rhodophyta-Hildenbrandia_rubra.ctg9640.p1 GENE.Plantae.Rhodophyta-Hildenbrandia_rubra.ctg9640~~Plantae.Rhodophyta-Hildenbrandia_rubra.ctg9640.p1  ORF type:complete len:363 (+),score=91.73 Plantae.Rhodophyta-Hildenbrandia_rubra.ctg9640:2470-3558(+)